MITANMIGTIGQILLVLFTTCGVMGMLLAIHCGSEYMKNPHKSDSLQNELRKLRGECEKNDGISSHNIFYRFFFR